MIPVGDINLDIDTILYVLVVVLDLYVDVEVVPLERPPAALKLTNKNINFDKFEMLPVWMFYWQS